MVTYYIKNTKETREKLEKIGFKKTESYDKDDFTLCVNIYKERKTYMSIESKIKHIDEFMINWSKPKLKDQLLKLKKITKNSDIIKVIKIIKDINLEELEK